MINFIRQLFKKQITKDEYVKKEEILENHIIVIERSKQVGTIRYISNVPYFYFYDNNNCLIGSGTYYVYNKDIKLNQINIDSIYGLKTLLKEHNNSILQNKINIMRYGIIANP